MVCVDLERFPFLQLPNVVALNCAASALPLKLFKFYLFALFPIQPSTWDPLSHHELFIWECFVTLPGNYRDVIESEEVGKIYGLTNQQIDGLGKSMP